MSTNRAHAFDGIEKFIAYNGPGFNVHDKSDITIRASSQLANDGYPLWQIIDAVRVVPLHLKARRKWHVNKLSNETFVLTPKRQPANAITIRITLRAINKKGEALVMGISVVTDELNLNGIESVHCKNPGTVEQVCEQLNKILEKNRKEPA